ncbi:MAG: hypothetical protein ACK5YV_12745 [Betaproteobacteria bacterium]|jgi:hypothetical protein
MKYNLFDGHRPKQEPRYCKQYEAETLKMLKLTGMLLVVFIATLVAVMSILANREAIDAIKPQYQAYGVFIVCLVGGCWWVVKFLKSQNEQM